MNRVFVSSLAGLAAAVFLTAPAASEPLEIYGSVSGGVTFLGDSDNEGAFNGPFTTGAGTNIPAGTVLPDGTPVGWTTEFDTGWTVSGAIGVRWLPNIRSELEVAYQDNGVDTHNGVAAGGIALDGEDAGVLITGSGNLGVSVGDLVADGQGSLDTLFIMANTYYDFGDPSWIVRPYIGAGVGVGIVDVDYSPSAVVIIDDSQTEFAYQAMAGLSTNILPKTELFGGYRFRATRDVETDVSLFNASLDIENQAHVVEIGLRHTF